MTYRIANPTETKQGAGSTIDIFGDKNAKEEHG